jgi:hypothetical protein
VPHTTANRSYAAADTNRHTPANRLTRTLYTKPARTRRR